MIRACDRAWRTACTGLAFLGFFAGSAVLAYLVLPTVTLLDRAGGPRRCRRVVSAVWRFFVDALRVTGVMRIESDASVLRLPPGPFVLVANHPTLLDVAALTALVPDLVFVAKRALFRSPIVGPLLSHCGHIDAGSGGHFSGAVVFERAVDALRAGTSVLIFPEGTRSPESGLGPLRPGAFHIAAAAGVPVVPVFLWCEPRTLQRGAPWYAVPSRTADITIEQLPTMETRSESPAALARALERNYAREITARAGRGAGVVTELLPDAET